jgi:Spy/CpxP family protein refolding chaperone
MLPDSNQSWQNPRVLVTLLLVFLSGGAVGSLAMRSIIYSRAHHKTTSPFWKGTADPVSFEKLKTDLNLTPKQCVQLKSILDDYAVFRRDLQEQVESFRATGKNRILDILTTEQRARFEQISSDTPPEQ